MDKEINYERDMSIDETSLDVEWLQQPSLMLKYANMASAAKKVVDEAKESLDVLKAQLDKQIRLDPAGFNKGIDKITETVIQNTILMLDEYKDANSEYIKARYEYEMAKNAVESLEQKKTALENLVKLHGQQYFAGPKVPRDLSKEWEQKQHQKTSNEVVKRMIRKTQS